MSFDFNTAFANLTDMPPFPWQRDLFERFVAGRVPATCVIPTGLGKTSVIAVWLLARQAGADLPRRLVYIVNRRTVVDQTTDEVERLRGSVAKVGIPAFAVSTLRGQMADNREWSEDPSRPAVISGTVDMIGSRLLFSGYRIGFKTRPLHAGFLGQDSLIVHDEAHLEPAFQTLLESIVDEQRRSRDRWPMKLMALSATARREDPGTTLAISDSDRRDPVVKKRIGATKHLALHACEDKDLSAAIVAKIAEFGDSKRAVLVFVRTVELVNKVLGALPKELQEKALPLTGTLRGLERDSLVETSEIFARFLPARSRRCGTAAGTVVLVCTSAGEVGVNLSADHLVTDLSTFDAMAQRFGRVNRFGEVSDTEVHVFHPPAEALSAEVAAGKVKDSGARQATLSLLQQLDGNASPAALEGLPGPRRRAAFSPPPDVLPATTMLFDAWALTTIRGRLPGRPPVTDYLHGVASWEPPTVQVAWRDEVDWVRGPLLDEYAPIDLLEDYPLKPHEMLRDRTSRIVEVLLTAPRTDAFQSMPIWMIRADGLVTPTTLGHLVAGDRKELERNLADCTLLLPPSYVRPVGGLFTDKSWSDMAGAGDVSDEWFGPAAEGAPAKATRRRSRVRDGSPPPDGMRLIRSLRLRDEHDDDESDGEENDETLAQSLGPNVWAWYEQPAGADGDGPRYARGPVTLNVHSHDVRGHAERFVEALGLDHRLARAVITAAWLHDIGKRRRVWQRSIGNRLQEVVLAKGGGRRGSKNLRGAEATELTPYRHELGSVLDAVRDRLLDEIDEADHDLVLHLVAAHHGRARPHFPKHELMDPETRGVDFVAEGTRGMLRFAHLQRRFGRWGLAYLESLVRAADYAASDDPSSFWEGP